MTKLVCKKTQTVTLPYALPLAQKRTLSAHSRHSDLKARGLITVMAVERDSHPNFPVCEEILSFHVHFITKNNFVNGCSKFIQ